jgi:hypothetical protein
MEHGSEDNYVNFVGSDRQCKFCNIHGHTTDDCQLFINFLMVSRFANQHPDLVVATLKKHSTLMRICPPGRGRPVNTLDMGPCTDVNDQIPDETTPDGGQVLHFDQCGLVCHLTDDSTLYEYESDNESLHLFPFTTRSFILMNTNFPSSQILTITLSHMLRTHLLRGTRMKTLLSLLRQRTGPLQNRR